MMPEYNLINMNGRMYDPVTCRFLSPDPYIQMPDNSQNFNRYSYCLNNPLKYTDPSGEWLGIDDLFIAGIGFVAGYVSNGISTGNWGWSSVKSGLMSAGSAWLGYNTAGLSTGTITSSTLKNAANIGINNIISTYSPSVSFHMGAGFGLSFSPMFGFGENGLTGGISTSLLYNHGDLNINLTGGFTNNYTGWNATASYKGWGGGFGRTSYIEETVRGNILGCQKVGTITLLAGGNVSFRISNDLWGDKADRWRTSAAELGIGDFTIGTYVTTNHGEAESIAYDNDHPKYNGEDDILGYNPYKGDKGGAWKVGQIYSAPLWIGVKTGNHVHRFGYSHKVIQSLTQNAVHKYFVKTPYFLDDSNFYKGVFSYSGSHSPFSLW